MRPLTHMSLCMVPTSLLLFSLLSIVLFQPTAAAPVTPAQADSTLHTAGPVYNEDYWELKDKTQPTFYEALFSLSSVMSEVAADACNGGDPKIHKAQSDRCEKSCQRARSRYADFYVPVLIEKSLRRGHVGCIQGTDIHIEDMDFVHKLSFLTRVCAWQCSCTVFNLVKYIRMPQVTHQRQTWELSPKKDDAYWKSFGEPFKGKARCHVADIKSWVSEAALLASAKAQDGPFGNIAWEVRLEGVVDEHLPILWKKFDDEMSMKCYCHRHFNAWHTYFHGHCKTYAGHGQPKPKSTHPPQDVAAGNQHMCPWPPTWNPLAGNVAHSSNSGQMPSGINYYPSGINYYPSGINHYPQSSSQGAAAGSSQPLTSQQQLLDYSISPYYLSPTPNDHGLPKWEIYEPWSQQCLSYNPSENLQAHGQCQPAPFHGESSGQGHPSQHHDASADQQHVQTQNGQLCEVPWPVWRYDHFPDSQDGGSGNPRPPPPYI
ncbi:hypothetical protein BCR37DRAFT_143755 [Protomyces lactucae-debilis]|uniref:Uncharacterized protein n=1 Tax=Protomyces lactucae-debilis TaxID=2754530 RepID=A0A1Y2FSX3_PROLT|nr:uncharacterized protein BCR37DRAFT_143755 [Protomyces lactucae-debilis]ORY87103.1 hypothetical protein BCR37DRAFT_143755 [Protomyces lactucae-debilis]